MYIWQYLLYLIHISAVYIRISAVYILSLTIFSSSSEPVSDSSVVGVWGEVLWVYSPKVIVTFKQEVYLLGFSLCKWCDCFCPEGALSPSSEVCSGDTELSSPTQNSTDEEKLIGMSHRMAIPSGMPDRLQPFTLENRWFLCAFVILCVSGSCVSFSVHLCLSRCCVSFFVHLCVTVCVCVSLSLLWVCLCAPVFVSLQCVAHFGLWLDLFMVCLIWWTETIILSISFSQLPALFVTGCLDYYFCTLFFTTFMVCLLFSQAVPGDTIQCPRVHREWLFCSVCLVSALCHGPEWRYGSFFVQ